MMWTQQKLAHYLGRVRTVVEFEGVTGEELDQIFRGEAMKRLQSIQDMIDCEDLSNEEKVAAIRDILDRPENK